MQSSMRHKEKKNEKKKKNIPNKLQGVRNLVFFLGGIIPWLVYVVNNHGEEFSSPKDRGMGPLPNGL